MQKKKENHFDYRYFALHIGIAVFYLLFFYVICESSFSADDIFNANAAACNYIEGDSVWKLTLRQWTTWFSHGRFYPFSNYTYLLFASIPNRYCYKMLILVTVYINSLLMSKCVEKITGSKASGLMTMLLFPFSLQLTPRFDGPLYCFHMLIQVVMLGSEISLLTVFKYLDTKELKKHAYWYLILGAFAYMIALGTYEIAFIMAAFLGLGTWSYTRSVKKSLKVLLPNIIVYIIMLGLNLLFRLKSSQVSYDGISVILKPKAVITTFFKQLYSTFPFSGFFADRFNGQPWSKRTWLAELGWQDIIMIIIFTILTYIIIKRIIAEKDKIKSINFTLFMGLSLMVFPSLIMAFMAKYQTELYWGRGHLSNYVQNFGLCLVLLSIVLVIQIKGNKILRNVFTGLFIILGIPFLLGQEMEARIDVEFRYLHYGYCRDTVLMAATHGIFDEIETNDILFGTSNYIYDNNQTKSFYTFAAKKEIQAFEKAQIIPMLTEEFGSQTTYDLTNTSQEYFAVTTYADSVGGYVFIGKIHSINICEDGSSYSNIYIINPNLYITGAPTFNLNDWKIIEQGKDGCLYTYEGILELP